MARNAIRCARITSPEGLGSRVASGWLTNWPRTVNAAPSERSRSHGRGYVCLLVEAFSSTVAFTMQKAYSSGRCSIFGMLTTEPCSSLLPVEYRFKFQ
jgi:hypothetical protein